MSSNPFPFYDNGSNACDDHPSEEDHLLWICPNEDDEDDEDDEDAVAETTAWHMVAAVTPMTSRPHFKSRSFTDLKEQAVQHQQQQQYHPMRRIRSRSLGSSAERHRSNGMFGGDWKDLWLTPTQSSHCLATPKQQHQQQQPPKRRQQQEQLDTGVVDSSNADTVAVAVAATKTSSSKTSSKTSTTPTPLYISILYGWINATIVLPVLMSFASIIYRDPEFQPYMPRLVKLTVFSGMIHQVCFSTFSSLPFCVGQVQDAGLIFLSSMASFIVQYCQEHHPNDEHVLLATTVVVLSLSTACLGLGLWVIGQCGLAQYVQRLPTSVVGGYLAYIGWFCGMAGIQLMMATSLTPDHGTSTWSLVWEEWKHVVPGIVGGMFIYVMVRWLRHMAVLPTCIVVLLVAFYTALAYTGQTIAGVTEMGWIRKADDSGNHLHWNQTWDYFQFHHVDWSVIPSLLWTELSMILVVAMSSSLDVAAIELELKHALDYNRELKMVGFSNFISGITGGYTGSYIFSQSIFSLRAGVTSRMAGYVLALCQGAFFLLQFPILSVIPNFFFGSLLTMICIDLLYEWLWDVRRKVTPVEYVICLSTFGLIQVTGVEFGILLGVLLYILCQKIGLRVTPENETVDTVQESRIPNEQSMSPPPPSHTTKDKDRTGSPSSSMVYGAIVV